MYKLLVLVIKDSGRQPVIHDVILMFCVIIK